MITDFAFREIDRLCSESVPIVSTSRGHRWIRLTHRPAMLRCIDCLDLWPAHGDLAPMPECPGECTDNVLR